MNKKILASIFVIGILALAMGYGTYSWFSDTKTSTSNTFTAGTLDISLGESETTEISIGNMAPGDVTGDWVITIKNDGTLNLAWFGDLVVTGGSMLRDVIYIDYAQMEFLDKNGNPNALWPEPTDNFILNGVGSGLYPDWYNTLAGLSTFGVITLKNFDGNNGMGVAPYEFMGALKPEYSYRLTLRFGFAKGAGNEYQGDVAGPVTISFKVDATQVNAEAIHAINSAWAAPALVDWMNTQLSHQP